MNNILLKTIKYLRRLFHGPMLFAREWISKPNTVGAIWPSSRQLAREMAAQVPCGKGMVIELGAGTGAVTQALLERGILPQRLIVIERSSVFVKHLKNKFPEVNVIQGDAAHLEEILVKKTNIIAIVSSLPLCSLPPTEVTRIVGQWRRLLTAAGVVIQFTYDLRMRPKVTIHSVGFAMCFTGIVWANLPPARILTLQKMGQPASLVAH